MEFADAPTRDRVDERDTVFARMERRSGTAPYADYYGRRPGLRVVDDRLRALPPLLDGRGLFHDPVAGAETAALFARIETFEPDAHLVASWAPRLRDASDLTRAMCAMARALGAVASGSAALDPRFVYTHKGRFDEDYGKSVTLEHAHAFVFLVEMDYDAMQRAPRAETLRESARQYWRAAVIARTVAAALIAGGVDASAKAHYDAHYDVLLPPLAVAAGLGELGRNNILVADDHGARVRIGAVTTDATLRYARPLSLGVRRFCSLCAKCADLCPSNALSSGPPRRVRGVRKWPTRVERCHAWWRLAGTDCGLCMSVCPFSHPAGGIHRLVRGLVRHAPWMNRLLLLLDDLIYRRRRWRRAAEEPK